MSRTLKVDVETIAHDISVLYDAWSEYEVLG
jgi:hypothetical protein